jgi:hypothetical protein
MNRHWGLRGSFAAALRGADVQICRFPRVSSAAADSTLGYSRAVPPGPGPIANKKRMPAHSGHQHSLHAIALTKACRLVCPRMARYPIQRPTGLATACCKDLSYAGIQARDVARDL